MNLHKLRSFFMINTALTCFTFSSIAFADQCHDHFKSEDIVVYGQAYKKYMTSAIIDQISQQDAYDRMYTFIGNNHFIIFNRQKESELINAIKAVSIVNIHLKVSVHSVQQEKLMPNQTKIMMSYDAPLNYSKQESKIENDLCLIIKSAYETVSNDYDPRLFLFYSPQN